MPSRPGIARSLIGPAAADWADRRLALSREQLGNTDLARRYDLCRIAWAVHVTLELDPPEVYGPDIEVAWGELDTSIITEDLVVALIGTLRNSPRPSFQRGGSGSDAPLSEATVQRTLSNLRGLCRELTKRGLIESDPFENDDIVTAVRGLHRRSEVHHYAEGDVDQILDACQVGFGQRDLWPSRDRLTIMFGALCGLRATEIAMLRWRDLEPHNAVVRVVLGAKGGKSRDIPVPGRLLNEFAVYHDERHMNVGRPSMLDPLLVRNIKGGWLSVNRYWIDRLVRRTAEVAGVDSPRGATVHGLRHTYGVDLAARNVPVPVLQQLFGHADSRTTSVYTQMSLERTRKALDEAGWL